MSQTRSEFRRFSIRLPRPILVCLATVVLVAVGVLSEPACAQQKAEPSGAQRVRREKLVEALLTPFERGPIAESAAQQLAVLTPDESLSATIVIKVVQRSQPDVLGNYVHPSFVAAIASQGRFAVPELIRTLRAEKLSDTDFLTVICSLGRMGPIAAEARAVLREKLSAESTPVWFKASLRAVLANTGEWREDLAKQIDNDLALGTADDKAAWLNREHYLYVMSRIHPRGKWLDERVAGRFMAMLKDPGFIEASTYSDQFRLAVITLCLAELDDKTRDSVVESLESTLDLAFKGDSLSAIELALALSRLRPQRGRAILQQLLRRLPSLKPKGDVAPFVIMQSDTAYLVVNDEIARVLAELTSSEEKVISQRAPAFLMLSGVAARAAVPTLLDCIKNNADEPRRLNAATALEWIADLSVVEEIESAAKAETSTRVSNDLLRAVKSLRRFD